MKTLFSTLLLLSALVFAPQAAMAQAVLTTPAIPSVTLPAVTLPSVPAQRITAGHALALGVGLFVGATAGSALIHGGALAAAIGGLAGLAVGHWAWAEAENF